MPQPRVPGSQSSRPSPPSELSERERQLWLDLIDSRPANYFATRETWPLLKALVMHAWQCEILAEDLRKGPTRSARNEYRRESQMVAQLASKLRLGKVGQRSHQSSEYNETLGSPRRRLWLVRDDDARPDR